MNESLQNAIRRDKQFVTDVLSAAVKELESTSGSTLELPGQASSWLSWKADQAPSLRAVIKSPFFARVDVATTNSVGTEPRTFLVSNCRLSGLVADDDWEVVSWTSPITANLLDRSIGTSFPSGFVQIEIGASAKFREVLPEIRGAVYRQPEGVFSIESVEGIDQFVEPDLKPEPTDEYEAAESFELGEIIELADSTQRTAMHLPFAESVIIEGPPGSGKTSIGIMRIPCLIDRQWKELGLDPSKSSPFHSPSTMRILVFNEEMVSYLDSLTRSLGVHGVPVSTVGDYFLQVCREAKTLSGRVKEDTDELAYMKAHPLALPAYWAGFKRHVVELWSERGQEYIARFRELEPLGNSLADGIERWVDQVANSTVEDGEVPNQVNLASRSSAWKKRAQSTIPEKIPTGPRSSFAHQRLSEERDAQIKERRQLIESISKVLREFASAVLARHASARAMFFTDEFQSLKDACVADGMQRDVVDRTGVNWEDQYKTERPRFSEYDVALSAWLGVHVSLAPGADAHPVIGGRIEHLTHVVVDEAQDVSATHAAVLRKLVSQKGSLTFVGDLNQHLKIAGGLRNWEDLGVSGVKRAVFDTNYRQSFELGSFVQDLHQELFGISPVWGASDKRTGPRPRVRVCGPSICEMAKAVIEEVTIWRSDIERCTIGILFDGDLDSEILEVFHESIEIGVEELLVQIYLVHPKSRDRALLKTDCVVIAPVESTKGLEFDAVIILDTQTESVADTPGSDRRRRNALYVAASRAKQGLSICIAEPSTCMRQLVVEEKVR